MHKFRAATIMLTCVVCVGCGSSNHPDTPSVSGTVTLDGAPVANAVLTFVPLEEARESYGRTDADGKYELYYTDDDKGAVPGKHSVRITTAGGGDEDSGVEGSTEKLPAKYNTRTELTAEVEAGKNSIDFPLVSEGEIIEASEE